MQFFYDPSANNQQYAFEDDVVVTGSAGAYVFTAPNGTVLGAYPSTLVPGTAPGPTPAQQLAQAQTTQNYKLTQACSSAITSGFSSLALGSAYSYPSDVNTQGNIDRASGTSGGFLWCAPGSGAWAFTAHTPAQAVQVRADLWSHIQTQQTKLSTLRQQVSAATSVAAVEAIVW